MVLPQVGKYQKLVEILKIITTVDHAYLFGLIEEREYFEYKVKQSDLIDKVLEYLTKHKIPFTTDENGQN